MSVVFPRQGTLRIVSPPLAATLGADEPLGLIGIFFERSHGTLHLAFLRGHRVQSPANCELSANLLVAKTSCVFVIGRCGAVPAASEIVIDGGLG